MPNVLVVDPDLASAATLSELLASAGHTAKSVTSGVAAVRTLETQHYDLVFVELKLPEEIGLELLGTITKRWPGLPVVVMTANGKVSEAVTSMRSGAADFVAKPIDADE